MSLITLGGLIGISFIFTRVHRATFALRRTRASQTKVLLLTAGLFTVLFYLLAALQATSATTISITAAIVADGGIVASLNQIGDGSSGRDACPQNPAAGCDFADDDGIVRTHDRVRYNFTYQINNSDSPDIYASDLFITSTLPLGMKWDIVPGFCLQPPSRITGDGSETASSILCQLDPNSIFITPGSGGTASSDLFFEAEILGENVHNTVHHVSATLYDSVGNPEQRSNSVPVTVTAAPRWDLEKQIQGTLTTDHNGVLVYRLEYRFAVQIWDEPVTTNIDSRIGNESPAAFSWIEDVSAISPNAEVLSCYIGGGSSNVLPYARFSNGTPPERSFSDGGQISCIQSAPGTPIRVEITDVDSSLNHVPTRASSGVELPAHKRMATGGVIRIVLPAEEVAALGALQAQSCSTDFDPITESGQSNFGSQAEISVNNCIVSTLSAGAASWTMFLTKGVDTWSSKVPGTATSTRSGDGFVSPEETFAMAQRIGNSSNYALNNVKMCAVLDTSTFGAQNIAPGQALQLTTPETALSSYSGSVTVEYASTYVNAEWPPTAHPAPANVEAECADETGPWFADTNELPGGPSAVTKVRVSLTDPLAPNQSFAWWLQTVSKANGHANGTILPIFATYRADEKNAGNWFSCIYDPGDAQMGHQNASPCGDRLVLSRAIARVDVETFFDDQIDAVAAGGSVGFVLKPIFTSQGKMYNSNMTIRATLPVGLTYITDSSVHSNQPLRPAISVDSMGGQTLIWDLGNQSTGAEISAIEFQTRAGVTLYNGEPLTLVAEIISPADSSSVEQRSARRMIVASVPAGLGISKVVQTPIILPGDAILYTIMIANHAGEPLNDTLDYIDIFPFNGDQRTPATAFSGGLELTDIATAGSETNIYYSSDPPQGIRSDPKAATNDFATGATNWCFGIGVIKATNNSSSCPATFAETTAIRVIDQTTLNRDETTEFTVRLQTSANREQDVYTNDASVAAPEVSLAANSNDVAATVLEPSIGSAIWYDIDGNGTQNDDEPGIANVAVRLRGTYALGSTAATSAISVTTVTDADGGYNFGFADSGLRPGLYTVTLSGLPELIMPTVDLDDGITSAPLSADSSGSFTLSPGEDKVDVNFGYQPYGRIEGIVWDDLNGDGFRAADEPGIGGVQVALCRAASTNPTGAALFTDCLDGAITTSDADGVYRFDEAALGEYFVEFVAIEGLFRTIAPDADSVQVPSGAGDVRSDADRESGRTPAVSITWSDPIVTLNAGYVQPASVASYVWIDGTIFTSNGVFDEFDDPIRGVTVILLDGAGMEVARTETDADGLYTFTGIEPGSYAIQVIPLWGFNFLDFVARGAAPDKMMSRVQLDGVTDLFTLLPAMHRDDVGAAALVSFPTDLGVQEQPGERLFLPLVGR